MVLCNLTYLYKIIIFIIHIIIGYLENDNVRVAITTHDDHQQLTILSPRFTETKSNLFKWYHNGIVELLPGVPPKR